MDDGLVITLLAIDVVAIAGCLAVLTVRRGRRSAVTLPRVDLMPRAVPRPRPEDPAFALPSTPGLIVSPDGSRSARWDGSPAIRDNVEVFAGPHGAGEPLFRATFVLADSPAEAAAAAARLGGTADARSLGAQGSTGPQAERLYYCDLVRAGEDARTIDLTGSDRRVAATAS